MIKARFSTAVAKLDGWMHFHRFDVRLVCDLHDWVLGMELRSLINERREGRRPHARMASYRRHPSTESSHG